MITWRFMKITKILALEYFELYSIVAISSGSFQVAVRVPSWGWLVLNTIQVGLLLIHLLG